MDLHHRPSPYEDDELLLLYPAVAIYYREIRIKFVLASHSTHLATSFQGFWLDSQNRPRYKHSK